MRPNQWTRRTQHLLMLMLGETGPTPWAESGKAGTACGCAASARPGGRPSKACSGDSAGSLSALMPWTERDAARAKCSCTGCGCGCSQEKSCATGPEPMQDPVAPPIDAVEIGEFVDGLWNGFWSSVLPDTTGMPQEEIARRNGCATDWALFLAAELEGVEENPGGMLDLELMFDFLADDPADWPNWAKEWLDTTSCANQSGVSWVVDSWTNTSQNLPCCVWANKIDWDTCDPCLCQDEPCGEGPCHCYNPANTSWNGKCYQRNNQHWAEKGTMRCAWHDDAKKCICAVMCKDGAPLHFPSSAWGPTTQEWKRCNEG